MQQQNNMDKHGFNSFADYKNVVQKHFETIDDYKKHQIIGVIYLTLTLFTVSFFGIFAIQPTIATISNLQKQYEDNQKIEQALDSKLQNLTALRDQYTQFQNPTQVPTVLERIFMVVPTKLEIPIFTRKVERLARDHQVSITAFSVAEAELYPAARNEKSIKTIPFTVSLEGNERQLATFSSQLMEIDRLVSIESILLSKPLLTEAATNQQPKLTITGNIHFNRAK